MKTPRPELSRLVAAAVINRRFRRLLLTKPAKAVECGYNGESFRLTPAERQLIFAILAQPPGSKVKTLEEFAQQLQELSDQIDAESDDGPKATHS